MPKHRKQPEGPRETVGTGTGLLSRDDAAGETLPADDLPPPIPGHPLTEVVGAFANSPFWDAVMEEIERRRHLPDDDSLD
jgi:hypothetical protein